MTTRPVLAVALAVLFVTAGCQAPTQQGASTAPGDAPATPAGTNESTNGTTTTDDAAEATELVRVTDELPFRATPVYERVGRMLGVPQADRPSTVVRVEDPPDGDVLGRASTSGFTKLVGIEPDPSAGESGGVSVGAFARGTRVTLFDHPNVTAAWQENVLAHEFVHVYQTRILTREATAHLDNRRDNQFLNAVLVEGSAEYVQERYGVRYQNESLDQTAVPVRWKNASAYVRMRIAPYEYGSRYFALRVDDAGDVTDVYDRPPRTAEQVLHGYAPDEERAKTLTVDLDAEDTEFTRLRGTTKGELFVRLALSTELDWERAVAASSGWGMDRLVHVSGDHGANTYAWVLRWDDAGEATEFREAFADYDAANDVDFRTESVTDETVVVYAGDESFVENASAAGNSSAVTVTV
ncbi:hypothetical protein [Halobacterium wangiae]|uniref:hypothetical protein n=1 Tax=Halobacterium wangiae TaxID=2902623 RepID=UPI001E29390E|nr:hypothetical protein [Halobacterium wangiae]